jgi:hypothetical protein
MIPAVGAALLYGALGSGGESDTAIFVALQAREGRRSLRSTYTFGHSFYEALQRLMSIRDRCQLPDWDGYGAEPVTDKTIGSAYRFLEALPPGLPEPGVGAEPDGHITLEWHRSAWRTVSVSISPDDNLHYSGLLGPNKQYGTEAFFGEVPKSILDLIRRLHA